MTAIVLTQQSNRVKRRLTKQVVRPALFIKFVLVAIDVINCFITGDLVGCEFERPLVQYIIVVE